MTTDVIAIDGPAASGKSTVAAGLAERLRIPYINTGSMYRAITLAAMRRGVSAANCTEAALAPVLERLQLDYVRNDAGHFVLRMDGHETDAALRSAEVAALVSPVAVLPNVRAWLRERQRALAAAGRLVMEGRDIGTEIFPDARFKFFLTATPEERARRRLAQSGENFDGATLESVAAAIAERDRIDSTRTVAPLRPAADAVLVDSTGLEVDEVVNLLARKVME